MCTNLYKQIDLNFNRNIQIDPGVMLIEENEKNIDEIFGINNLQMFFTEKCQNFTNEFDKNNLYSAAEVLSIIRTFFLNNSLIFRKNQIKRRQINFFIETLNNTGAIMRTINSLNCKCNSIDENCIFKEAVYFIFVFSYCSIYFEELFRQVDCVTPILNAVINCILDSDTLKICLGALNNIMEAYSSIDDKYTIFLDYFYSLNQKIQENDNSFLKSAKIIYVITKYGKNIEESYPMMINACILNINVHTFPYILYTVYFILQNSECNIPIYKSNIINYLIEYYRENSDKLYDYITILFDSLSLAMKLSDDEIKKSLLKEFDYKLFVEFIESSEEKYNASALNFIISSLPSSRTFFSDEKLINSLFYLFDDSSMKIKVLTLEALVSLASCSYIIQRILFKKFKENVDLFVEFCESEIQEIQIPTINLLNLFVMVNSGKSYKEITDFMETSGIIEAVQNIETDVDEIKRLKIEFLEKFK